ncbi:MAG: aminotransferase class V-fold PLP-dependent enzyme [Deltaproteobacteria bacterium]|nr:aminotransferase class V-fold PLP-dependent enzyme [Deltaproteobacteria bacterium]
MELAPNQKRALCGICPAGCWIIATYDDVGRLASVEPDPSSPLGITCRLGEHSREILYSPNRLKTPLRRKGPKGTYDFEPLSWDEAFCLITERLQAIKQKHGPEATCVYTGRGSFELAMCDLYQPKGVAVSSASSLLFPFGSPNTMGVGALCYVSYAMIAPHVTCGGMHITMFNDLENAELIVVWGANPATDSPPADYRRIAQAVKRGARLVVIDPRRTATAKIEGAQWVPIRPGTDGALALGMCAVLIEEELFDEDLADNWTHGFDEFADYAQHFRPEVVQSITGVPAQTVVRLAREIAGAGGAAPVMYTGLEYSDSGVQAIRATIALWALAGQLDVPGGRCFNMPGSSFPINREHLVANPAPEKALGRESFPLYTLYREESHANCLPKAVLQGEPYPIKGLISLGASLCTSWPKAQVWKDTLAALDFLVCIDIFHNADTAYADLVLPATTWYEINSYMTFGPVFRLREQVVPPVGEARNAFFIFSEIAERLGYGHLYPRNEEELLQRALEGSGFSLEQVREAGGQVSLPPQMMQYKKWQKGLLRSDGQPGFDTPTGKLELFSTILDEHGYAGLPEYVEPSESPVSRADLAVDYPLVFNSGARVTTDFRSQFHHIPGLVKARPEPTVAINTKDAKERGIADGDWVRIASPRGRVRMRALVTEDIVPGAVDANMGGGGPLGPKAWQACNINDLTDLKYDPISGFPIYKALLCQVEREQSGEGAGQVDSGEQTSATVLPGMAAAPKQGLRIYLDHNATTPLDPLVSQAMSEFMAGEFGNPSAIYREGRQAANALAEARRKLASLLGTTARRMVFTSGGSEANNQVIKGVALDPGNRDKRLITSSVEHPSVLKTFAWLSELGWDVVLLPVDAGGLVRPQDLAEALERPTALVSIMTANNETGALQPIAELVDLAHQAGALFHTDAVQAVGKIPLSVQKLGVDFLSLSGHKLHGPKGVGALYIRKGLDLEPLVHGGGQESGRRAGTENTASIVGLGAAAELAARNLGKMEREVAALRDKLWQGISDLVPQARLNGPEDQRLPNTLNVSLPGVRGESLVLAMDQKGVSLSSGSACRSGSPEPSHALLAMGLSSEEAHCALRFSLGRDNTAEEIDHTLEMMSQVMDQAGSLVRFVPCR